jgi:hypothetical protein
MARRWDVGIDDSSVSAGQELEVTLKLSASNRRPDEALGGSGISSGLQDDRARLLSASSGRPRGHEAEVRTDPVSRNGVPRGAALLIDDGEHDFKCLSRSHRHLL